jgi:hypothetical protein
VRAAAEQLVGERQLLPEDVELCVRLARRRYLLVSDPTAPPPRP